MDMTTVDCATGEITVTPLNKGQRATLAEAATREQEEQAQREAARAQRLTDAAAVMDTLPNQAAKDSLARLLGLNR